MASCVQYHKIKTGRSKLTRLFRVIAIVVWSFKSVLINLLGRHVCAPIFPIPKLSGMVNSVEKFKSTLKVRWENARAVSEGGIGNEVLTLAPVYGNPFHHLSKRASGSETETFWGADTALMNELGVARRFSGGRNWRSIDRRESNLLGGKLLPGAGKEFLWKPIKGSSWENHLGGDSPSYPSHYATITP